MVEQGLKAIAAKATASEKLKSCLKAVGSHTFIQISANTGIKNPELRSAYPR